MLSLVDITAAGMTLEEYRAEVALEAFCHHEINEKGRREKDWWEAVRQINQEYRWTGREVTEQRIRVRANELYEKRRDRDAESDWLYAEAKVANAIRRRRAQAA